MIENVIKKDSQLVIKCLSVNANTVQQWVDEMVDDEERTLVSELQH